MTTSSLLDNQDAALSRGTRVVHFSLYISIYILQGAFGTHVASFSNIYFQTQLQYSYAWLALINFLVYLPLIIKPVVFLFLQRESSTIAVKRNILPSGMIFLIFAIITGFITSDQSPVLMIIAFVAMQLSLVPMDLTVDSYIIPQYPTRSVLITVCQIGSGFVGGQIAYALVIAFTNQFTTPTWTVYYILLGLLVIPAMLLGLLTKPSLYTLRMRKIMPLRDLLPEDQPRMKWLLIFIVGINSSYIAGSVMDLWLKDRFGTLGAIQELGRNANLFAIGGLVLVGVFSIIPKFFRKIRFPLLYFIGGITALNFLFMVYAPFNLLLITQSVAIGMTHVFAMIYLSLMLEVIPLEIRPQWYQVAAMIFAIARSVFEPLGLLLAMGIGNANVILLTAGLMFLNIPIVAIFARKLHKAS